MGLFNSRSASASSWLLMSLALLLLQVQAQPSRYEKHNIRRISHHSSNMQSASPSFLHPISVPLHSGPILRLPPPPKKFTYATIAPILAKDDPNDQNNGFIQLVQAKLPLYPSAPYYEQTVAPKTAAPTTKAATTVPPTTTARPKTVKTYFKPTKPYVRPPPPTAKPFTTPKAFIFKTAKPTKTPFNTIQKVTKATPAPTSSVAPPLVPELAPLVHVRGVGGEMMKHSATKAIEPATVASAVTAPAATSTAAPSVVPPASTDPAPVSTDAPATKEAVKESTPVPLSFSSFQPYQRPLFRPAIYTRPPFRPHLQNTLLPKSTEAAATSEDEKSIVDVRVSLSTTTEVVPEIVTEKEEVLEPASFDDFEMSKVLPDAPEENSIPKIDEEPNSSESTELPEVLLEELPIVEDPEETIISEDDATDIEDIETIPETPTVFEVISSEPEVLEVSTFEPEILETIPELPQIIESIPIQLMVEDEPDIFETITDAPEILEIIPEEPIILEITPDEPEILDLISDEPEILEFIPFDPEILESIPEEPQIIDSIPEEFMVEDVVSDETTSVEIITEIPITFELIEPQIVESEKLLPIENIFSVFDPIFSDSANDIRLSIEKTEKDEGPEKGFEISSISEDISKVVPVAAELPKIIEDLSEPDLVYQESQENLKAPKLIPGLEEEVEENTPITDISDNLKSEKPFNPEIKTVESSTKKSTKQNVRLNNLKGVIKSRRRFRTSTVKPTTRIGTLPDTLTKIKITTVKHPTRSKIIEDLSEPDLVYQESQETLKAPELIPGLEEEVEENTPITDISDNLKSDKPFNPEIKTAESSTKKSTKQKVRLNNLKGVIKSRRRFRTSTVKPTTRIGTLPDTLTKIKITTVKPPTRSTLFPTWDEIQIRKASREKTSSETKEANSGFDTGFGSGFGTGFGDWGSKL